MTEWKLRENVTEKSVAEQWMEARKEWDIVEIYLLEGYQSISKKSIDFYIKSR